MTPTVISPMARRRARPDRRATPAGAGRRSFQRGQEAALFLLEGVAVVLDREVIERVLRLFRAGMAGGTGP